MQLLHIFFLVLKYAHNFVNGIKIQMIMSKSTFVISDESINSYGYIVRTDGIDTTAFERNPIMLYMHERKTVVGRWDNIRKDGKKLLADAVFDESTELGRTVKSQVENGFLRSASIGVDIIEEKEIDGVKVVTKSVLYEVSIVDIPANQNALKLYKKGKLQRFALAVPEKVGDLRMNIIRLLGLDDDVSDEDIITEIQGLLNAPDEASTIVDEAIKDGFIEARNRGDFVTMARITPKAFHSFLSSERGKRNRAVKETVEAALGNRRIVYNQKEFFERVGEKMGVEVLAQLFSEMPRTLRLTEIISNNRKGWTLADYRMYAPEELKNNPKLYAELVEEENNRGRNGVVGKQSLDYLRKHNPEYLKEHPEEYQKLLSNI